jgi:hypothetical protein
MTQKSVMHCPSKSRDFNLRLKKFSSQPPIKTILIGETKKAVSEFNLGTALLTSFFRSLFLGVTVLGWAMLLTA